MATLAGIVALLGAFVMIVCAHRLPPIDAVTDYRPRMPMRIFTADHVLIAEFGEERRQFVPLDDLPVSLRQAVLAIEDDRFYTHGGVDMLGVARALMVNTARGGNRQGGSTITMQVARNFFLSSEKTYTRKLYEALLAFRIEQALSKDQILALYMNQIYLGHRTYGFAAAARTYFGKPVQALTLAQSAVLAGLPKAPSSSNPITNAARAVARQQKVLQRMYELGYIDEPAYRAALAEPLKMNSPAGENGEFTVAADYVAELVRQQVLARFPEDAYTRGYVVTTTLMAGEQEAANRAVRQAVARYDQYDRAHRSPRPSRRDATGKTGNPHDPKDERTADGALTDHGSGVQAALVALTPHTGAIRALVGGADFNRNQFNHVTQAWRQPGSALKPFVYSAALEQGIGPATLINDAPFVLDADHAGGHAWTPKNYGGQFNGPTTMREGLRRSKNLVTIRIMQAVGAQTARDHLTLFGFDPARHPAYLSTALGAGETTPLQLAGAYAVFANGGFRVQPYLISDVRVADGQVVMQASPAIAEFNAPRAISARNAFLMNDLLHDVAVRGSGAATNALGRSDLGAKTGTTNDSRDAWFAGYQQSLITVAWMGFDQPRSLGARATGAGLALPMWLDFMRPALKGIPNALPEQPGGVVRQDGEWYYADLLPGRGFVAAIDLPSGSDVIAQRSRPTPVPPASDRERLQAMSLFEDDT